MSKIENRIIEVRSVRVLVDYELADLYQVNLKILLQAVQRNSERFPSDFMFRLTMDEYIHLKRLRSVPPSHGGRRAPPNAFTEQGVAMLSSVLNSKTAIKNEQRDHESICEVAVLGRKSNRIAAEVG
jgi:hypothetical protein